MTNSVTNNADQPKQPAHAPAHITRISPLSNRKRTLQIPQYTPEEFERRLYAYEKGNIDIDDALPLLSDAAKLFVTRGFTLEEWEEYENKL
jgi:hypothetical protein